MKTIETVGSLGEFQLIQRFLTPSTQPQEVTVGPGDDAAVLSIPRTQQLVVTTDTLVEGIHFTSQADPFLLGQKALRVNLSDMAAMAGKPCWYLLALSLPETTATAWVEALAQGLQTAAQRPSGNVARIGGNLSRAHQGGISITITLMGLTGKGRAVTRCGAQVGDHILVTGTIGDAALGLAVQQKKLTVDHPEEQTALQRRLDLPDPPVELAIALQEAALTRSAIDISDGLIADLKQLCTASKVGAKIRAEQIPLSPAAKNQVQGHGIPLSQLLTGGEDYELLFTAAPSACPNIHMLAKEKGVRVTEIGVITHESDVIMTHQEQIMPIEGSSGWTHF